MGTRRNVDRPSKVLLGWVRTHGDLGAAHACSIGSGWYIVSMNEMKLKANRAAHADAREAARLVGSSLARAGGRER